MKVLMTADTVGGVWTHALDLARGLAPHGIQVTLATMGALPTPDQHAEAASVPGLSLEPDGYKLEWMEEPWADVSAAGDWLLSLEECVRPDVVHLNGYAHGSLPWRAPVLIGGHSCVLSWWNAVHGEDAPPAWDRYRHEVARGLCSASLVVAPTCAMLDALDRHYGPLGRTLVIPNGRDPSGFRSGEKEPVILAAGRLWDEGKNVAALAAVAARLPWPVLVAGDSSHPGGGQTRTEGMQPLGRLTPAELAAWLSRAAVYALPARYEPFGLSVLEAALSGCTLVLGDIASLREVWADAAVFVAPDDHDALEQALSAVIADGERRTAMAARARERAARYTVERMAGEYAAAYRELITSRARTPGPSPAQRARGASSEQRSLSHSSVKARREAPLPRTAGEGSGEGVRFA